MLPLFIFAIVIQTGLANQHLPPGVNPQHYQQYQQQGVPQHHQPPPPPGQPQQQQYAQQPQHVPQQQQQQQPPQPSFAQPAQQFGQGPPRQQFGGQRQGDILNTANIQQEREHIQEHMEVPIDTSKMSEQELQFHYFKMHDTDNNNRLDGQELIKSLIHWHDKKKGEDKHEEMDEGQIFTDDELASKVDEWLDIFDADDDGYGTFGEYKLGMVEYERRRKEKQAAEEAGKD